MFMKIKYKTSVSSVMVIQQERIFIQISHFCFSTILNALHTVTAEFIDQPLRVDEFTWRVTKASIDSTIDCQWICPKADVVTFHSF